MNLRRLSTAGSRSGPSVNSSSSIERMKGAGPALLLRELREVAVAGGAQNLEALLLDRRRQCPDAEAGCVLGAVVFVDDDDRELEAQHRAALEGAGRKARSVGRGGRRLHLRRRTA